ncbi:MAG: GMC oxidoreductase [Akkermansiaceae bacterium]
MFLDVKDISDQQELECEVLIVGSGAAGVPLACELIGSGKETILLESGAEQLKDDIQNLTEGELPEDSRHGPLRQYRKRVFGGTTTVWGGRCSPFDAQDFEERSHVPASGWPITREEMDPFYERAHEYLFLGDYSYDAAEMLDRGAKPIIPKLDPNVWKQDGLWRFSLPVDIGAEHREKLAKAQNVQVICESSCLELVSTEDGKEITAAKVGCLDGKRYTIKARKIILAAGGLENTRILLLSDQHHPGGMGNHSDHLGRYYASHVSGDFGEVKFTPGEESLIWEYQQDGTGVYCKRHFRLSEEVQQREGLLNLRCILTHPPFAAAGHGNGILSAAYLAKRFFKGQIPPEYSKEMAESGYHNVSQHLRNVLLNIPSLIGFGWHWTRKRIFARRKYPSVSLHSKENSYTIHFDSEQAPNWDSRVMLSDQEDAFGQKMIKVDWRYAESDLESVVRTAGILREELEKAGVGAFVQDEAEVKGRILKGFGVGSHHIGATRMSDDPAKGVVDRDCQVHGIRGLYLASPSVFPTGSFANPVLTTTAIAIRIADHLQADC